MKANKNIDLATSVYQFLQIIFKHRIMFDPEYDTNTLFLVIGRTGSGKDTVIKEANEIINFIKEYTLQVYSFIYSNKTDRDIVLEQVITGCSCIEFDKIFTLNNKQILEVNDIIIYKNVGAYTMCLSPLFIRYFPNVYLYDNNSYKIIRNKWSANEYIQQSKLI